MSVPLKTRAAVSGRWICAAVAAFVLASGASLTAQEQKDKDKKPAPAHKTAPPPANKSGSTPQSGGEPAGHPGTPPANNAVHPGNPPANTGAHPAGNTPANNVAHPPAGTPNDRPRPAGGPAVGAGAGRPGGAPGRPAVAANRPVYHGANGAEVHYGANGRPAVVRAHGMVITHAPNGLARSEFVRPDHSVIVTQGGHYGYVQRPYVVGGVGYVQRTYIVGGVSYARIYRPYMYHGIGLNLYVSSHYYAPAFYGWAYTPWSRPVVFGFGWGGSPWFGFYGGYFAPYPAYAGPAYWLTDYMIAASLQDAYQQQQAAAAAQANAAAYPPPPAGGQAALTPDVKQAIADEVHRQLDQERVESQAGAPAQGGPQFLADNSSHVFVVGTALAVQSQGGECGLTEGDVLQMTAPPPANSATADLAVLASKGQDCRKGSLVSVAIPDLQEMQNHMRETLDQGLADLQKRQGQGGLPAEPPAAQRPPVEPAYATAAPPPDSNIASEVSQQAESATQAENEVLEQAQTGGPAAGGGAPQSVSLGMTIDQVVAMLGQPQVVGDLGSKKVYNYGNMKVIFVDGKVTDVQ